jgi:GTP-binding protein
LVLDGTTGITPDDYMLISRLRNFNKPIVIAVNKSDVKDSEYTMHEAAGLGFKEIVMVSGAHSRGIEDLLEVIVSYCSTAQVEYEQDNNIKITLLGKPNVGKSSLLNLLSGNQRAVVSDIAGTTREAVRDDIVFYNQNIEVADTAGVRRSRSIDEELEHMMVGNTFDTVKNSHIVLLVLDASAGDLVDQELKLAHYVFDDLYKSLIVVWNKVDLVDSSDINEYIDNIEARYEYFFRKVLSIRISCKTEKNVGKIMPLVMKAWEKYTMQFDGYTIFNLFKSRLTKTPLMHKKNIILLKNIHQVNSKPLTMYLEVNECMWIDAAERAFFENILRAEYDLKGVPVKWVVRKK